MTNTSESNLPLKNGSLNAGDGEAMATQLDGVGVGIGIGAIAHEIGLTKDTLRVWERRYGFPQPLRSTGGERLYPQEKGNKLRLVKRLPDAGHRPSKVLPQSITRLQQLAEDSGVGQDAPDVELDRLVE